MNLDHNSDFTVGGAGMSGRGTGRVRRRLSTIAGESGQKHVFAAIGFCVSAEAEDVQGDGDSRRLWDQLQHGAVFEFCEPAFGAGAICADPDEYCGAARMHAGSVDAGEWVWVLDYAGAEQLCGEPVLPSRTCAGVESGYSTNAADGDRNERWLQRVQGRRSGYPAGAEPDGEWRIELVGTAVQL